MWGIQKKMKPRIRSEKIEAVFGLPVAKRTSLSYFEALAIRDCINYCYEHKAFTSYLWENHSYTAREKMEKVLKNAPGRKETASNPRLCGCKATGGANPKKAVMGGKK
jgi:hypothetical protein